MIRVVLCLIALMLPLMTHAESNNNTSPDQRASAGATFKPKQPETRVTVRRLNGTIVRVKYPAYALPQFYGSGAYWYYEGYPIGFYSRGRNDSMGLMHQMRIDALDSYLVTSLLIADPHGGSTRRGTDTILMFGIVRNF